MMSLGRRYGYYVGFFSYGGGHAPDADMSSSCNWVGVHEAVRAMDWYGRARFLDAPLVNITLDGKAIAAVQNVDNFSFA